MSTSKPDGRRIVVMVRRDGSGALYSEVVDKLVPTYSGDDHTGVVIDRQRGRQLTQDTLVRRAELLAGVLGVPLEQDLRWPCQAARKTACRCPECIAKGRA